MISFIGNKPALQIGPYQVVDYDLAWLDLAMKRALVAVEFEDFPFIDDIREGVSEYLETYCPLQLLPLEVLYDRVREMLRLIGCAHIAEHLETLAPPVKVSLVKMAREAGNGFELAFFASLRAELNELRLAKVEEIKIFGARDSAMILRGAAKWNKNCESLLHEINQFLETWKIELPNKVRPVLFDISPQSVSGTK